MTFPTIHLNGTHPRNLLEDQCAAMSALRVAITALEHTGPNGRDYHLQGPTALAAALEEHSHRVLVLRNILAELTSIAEHVQRHMR